MSAPRYRPYEPQLVPVAAAPEIWMVEGPEVDYRLAGVMLPCPTRMTVVRLGGSALWMHSPVAWSPALGERIAVLGEVRFVVALNTYHHLQAAAWCSAYPGARLYATRDLVARAGPPFDAAVTLNDGAPPEWAGEIDTHVVDVGSFVEAAFLHRPSRTLVVTDLMQNFEAERVRGRLTRMLLRAGGATGPAGATSLEIRAAALGRRAAMRRARGVMLGWGPERVILAHGRGYDSDAAAEVARAFRWAGR